jgi:hypothetical protein
MEQVLSEFKVIETDDGFRIEIKGDKEKLKAFMHDFRGHKGRHGRSRHRMRGDCGPFGMNPMLWMHMASSWDPDEWDDEGESKED